MSLRRPPLLARDIIGIPTPAIDAVRTEHQNEIIETWYTDPFERRTASGPAGELRRRENLIKLLQDRGFHRNRAVLAAEYLMKSKGLAKDDEQLQAESRAAIAARHKSLKELAHQRRAARRRAEQEARQAAKDCEAQRKATEKKARQATKDLEAQRKATEKKRKRDEKQGIQAESDTAATVIALSKLPTPEPCAIFDDEAAEDLSIKDDPVTDCNLSVFSEEPFPTELICTTQRIQFTTDTTELDRVSDHDLDRRTQAVKSALHKFDLLYGEAGLQPPTEEVKFNFLRGGPIPVPNTRYHSQGHGRLMKVTVRDREVYGEEGAFEDILGTEPQPQIVVDEGRRPRKDATALTAVSTVKKESKLKKEFKVEKTTQGRNVVLIDEVFETESMRFREFF